MNMIETVAKAIEAKPIMCGTYTLSGEDAVNIARAAIEAMKIPTEAMIGVGPEIPGLRAEIIATWTDMISKALEGGE